MLLAVAAAFISAAPIEDCKCKGKASVRTCQNRGCRCRLQCSSSRCVSRPRRKDSREFSRQMRTLANSHVARGFQHPLRYELRRLHDPICRILFPDNVDPGRAADALHRTQKITPAALCSRGKALYAAALGRSRYRVLRNPMPKRSVAARSNSSLTDGCAIPIRARARSARFLLRRYAAPYSVTMYCA